MKVPFSEFDNFCNATIEKYRIDIRQLSFDNETDKEVFVIKHLIHVMQALYNGIREHNLNKDYCKELKSIAKQHLQQYTNELYKA